MCIRKVYMQYGQHFKILDALKGVSQTIYFAVYVSKEYVIILIEKAESKDRNLYS